MKTAINQAPGTCANTAKIRAKPKDMPFPGLSKEVLAAAQKAVLACKKPLPLIAREQVLITPKTVQKAQESGTLQISSTDNRWALQLDRKEQWLAHFACKHSEIERYAGRYLEINIGERVYLMGNINKQGKAKGIVPDLTGSPVIIHIGPKMRQGDKQPGQQS